MSDDYYVITFFKTKNSSTLKYLPGLFYSQCLIQRSSGCSPKGYLTVRCADTGQEDRERQAPKIA